ncbi:hypothetical protein E2562_018464 [Oryza meyeriana var. granulata]|uniref:Uncharacterized protein n=1 Tax=Oryza meyeriana var. granulata TaxID=110450 RepID=A0A6G1EMF4_9ORYZ|nr:hypothetical protein E2562_018464 [Oryza meyeriana var. granulata]
MKAPPPLHSPSPVAKRPRFSPFVLLLVLFLLLFSFLYGEDLKELLGSQAQARPPLHFNADGGAGNGIELPAAAEPEVEEERKTKRWKGRLPLAANGDDEDEECNVFSGIWVRDEAARPLYREADCPYIPPQLTCEAHGRPETAYQRWRWQPHDCTLPAFNAAKMLEALRGKRVMFVGDSLGRGQFTSLVCLLLAAVPDPAARSFDMSPDQQHSVFTAVEYNATVEFYWAPFLLQSNADNAVVHRISDRMVRRGSIGHHGRHWEGVDVIVFNTYLWWCTGLEFRILDGPFDDSGNRSETATSTWVSTEEAYAMAFREMLQWTREHMDFNTTRVFFTSMSPTHGKSQDWGGEAGGNCYGETEMIDDPAYWGSDSRRSVMRVIGDVLHGDGADVPVTFLNVTQLSLYRKDAHTSVYKKQWTPPTAEQLADPKSYADCVHWCLPGLQDTWNELLYTKLFYP